MTVRSSSIEISRPRPTRRQVTLVALAVLLALTAGGVLAIVAATPSTSIPVGISSSSGVSMGDTMGGTGIAVYADLGEPEIGDVIVFDGGPEWVLHRVVDETPRGYVTEGDNPSMGRDQPEPYTYVTSSNYAGEVLLVVDEQGIHVDP